MAAGHFGGRRASPLGHRPLRQQRARAWFGSWREVPLVAAAALEAPLAGPALLVEPHSTVVLEEGWRAQRLPGGELLLEDGGGSAVPAAATADPARIEIFNNLFMHVAEQMGEVLKATAQSVNISERLDYSCALFDARGGLVANAPHMPVHLGSMGASVRAVMHTCRERLRPGDAWLLNSPYHGGTHLPDMTVVTPVFVGDSGAARFLRRLARAPRRHRRRRRPGSMPPFSRTIEEEGILFECFQLVAGGVLRERELRAALGCRRLAGAQPAQNVADLRAQLAANARGIAEIERAVTRHGLAGVHAVHAGGAGQRRALRARTPSRSSRPGSSATSSTTARRSRCASTSTAPRGARASTSAAPRRRAPTTSTRRARCAWPPCCTCSAR